MADIEIASDVNELPRLVEFVESFAESEGVSGPVVVRLQLTVEELITNVVHHGYAGSKGPIHVTLERDGARVYVEVRDRGSAFDPFEEAAVPDLEASVEDRSIGGLGVHLVRELAEECAYERRGEENRVRVALRV